MKITFYGHASLGIEVGGKNIIVDPYISANEMAANIDIMELKADYIFITHAHGDHILDAHRYQLHVKSYCRIACYVNIFMFAFYHKTTLVAAISSIRK